MKSFIEHLRENESELSDDHQKRLSAIGQRAFNWQLHNSRQMFHAGERSNIRARYQIGHGQDSSEHGLLNRMSPEDYAQHSIHDERQNFHLKKQRDNYFGDMVYVAIESGIPKQKVTDTVTLAKELARTAHTKSSEGGEGMARRFNSLLGEDYRPSYLDIGHSEDLGDHDAVDLFHIDGRGKLRIINHGKLLKKYKVKDPNAQRTSETKDASSGHILWKRDNDNIQLSKGPILTGRIDHNYERISLSSARSTKGMDEMLFRRLHREVSSHMDKNFPDYKITEY